MISQRLLQKRSAILRVNPNCHGNRDGQTNDFVIDLPGQFNELRAVAGVEVLNVTMPNSFYNVPDGQNFMDIEYVDANSNDIKYRVYLDPGVYKATNSVGDEAGLVQVFKPGSGSTTDIQTAYRALVKGFPVGVSFTNIFSDVNYRASNNKMNFTLASGVTNFKIGGPLARTAGFNTVLTSFIGGEAPYFIDLQGFTEVYLHSADIVSNSIEVDEFGGRKTDCFCIVPVGSVPQNAVLYWQPTQPLVYEYPGGYRSMNRIRIQLKDCRGQPISFLSSNFFVTFRVYYDLSY